MVQPTELWERFVEQGSREAYYELYVHYYSYLSLVGAKRKCDAGMVKDAINDIFLFFWDKRKSLKHIAASHNYIVTSFLRKLAKKNPLVLRDIESAELSFGGNFEDAVFKDHDQQLLYQTIKKQVAALPPKQRELIYQKYYLGLSYNEISASNNLSINTVYNTIYTAIKKLKLSIHGKKALELLTLAVIIIFF